MDINKSTGFDDISSIVLQSCAEALREPLHHLFTLSLCCAVVPSSWKIYKVILIFKAGNPTELCQELSSYFNSSKVLERLTSKKIIGHVTKFISPFQFGFTKSCSALQQMLIFINQIVNFPSQTDVIYFDIIVKFSILCPIVSYSRSCGYLAYLALYGPG